MIEDRPVDLNMVSDEASNVVSTYVTTYTDSGNLITIKRMRFCNGTLEVYAVFHSDESAGWIYWASGQDANSIWQSLKNVGVHEEDPT